MLGAYLNFCPRDCGAMRILAEHVDLVCVYEDGIFTGQVALPLVL